MQVVEGLPQKFVVFLKILKECYWLGDLVEAVCDQYGVAKKAYQDGEMMVIKADKSLRPYGVSP